jgi:SNF2 family DNA or RNA helicase
LVKEEELSNVKLPSLSLSCNGYSSKIKMALELLHSLPPLEAKCEREEEIERKPFEKKPVITEKAIVFSQWTRMLDMLEVPLKESGLQYRRLDGTMSVTAREKAVKDFNMLPEVLLSLPSVMGCTSINFSGRICRPPIFCCLLFSVFAIGMLHYLKHLMTPGSYFLYPG